MRSERKVRQEIEDSVGTGGNRRRFVIPHIRNTRCTEWSTQPQSQVSDNTQMARIVTHSNRLHVFLFDGLGMAAEFPLDPLEDVEDGLRCWNDVERWRAGSSLLEVADPQLGPGKLPLHVGAFL